MDENKLLERITVNPDIYGGKPISSLLEPEDVQACIAYARRLVGRERIEPVFVESNG